MHLTPETYALALTMSDEELADATDLFFGVLTGIKATQPPSTAAVIRLIEHVIAVLTTVRADPDRTVNQN